MEDSKELIFISFSKDKTGEVAQILYDLLKSVYSPSSPANADVFLSSESLSAGSFSQQIHDALMLAKCGITILSPENAVDSPWLMYEAGALQNSVKLNGGELVIFLFKRHRDNVEAPIKGLQYCEFQNIPDKDYREILKILKYINNLLLVKCSELHLENVLQKHWVHIYSRFQQIDVEMRDLSMTSDAPKTAATAANGSVSLSAAKMNRYSTEHQRYIYFENDFAASSPRGLEGMFRKVLDSQIGHDWLCQNKEDIKYNKHRVIVNGTRISTFVVFTDGYRMVLFNRLRDVENTSVENDRYDVFGSVAFENSSIKVKLKSNSFLDAPILKIEPIEGAAIEANRKKSNSEVETAVMFGLCVYMSESDIDLAKLDTKKDEIEIFEISSLLSMKEQLTSKAELGLAHLVNGKLTK